MVSGCWPSTRSVLLSRSSVSGVISSLMDEGTEPERTSGRERTQSETSAEATLEEKSQPVSTSFPSKEEGRAYAARARSIPIDSTKSDVLRKPAVSATMTGIPPISKEISKTSLVVPGRGVTIAASR